MEQPKKQNLSPRFLGLLIILLAGSELAHAFSCEEKVRELAEIEKYYLKKDDEIKKICSTNTEGLFGEEAKKATNECTQSFELFNKFYQANYPVMVAECESQIENAADTNKCSTRECITAAARGLTDAAKAKMFDDPKLRLQSVRVNSLARQIRRNQISTAIRASQLGLNPPPELPPETKPNPEYAKSGDGEKATDPNSTRDTPGGEGGSSTSGGSNLHTGDITASTRMPVVRLTPTDIKQFSDIAQLRRKTYEINNRYVAEKNKYRSVQIDTALSLAQAALMGFQNAESLGGLGTSYSKEKEQVIRIIEKSDPTLGKQLLAAIANGSEGISLGSQTEKKQAEVGQSLNPKNRINKNATRPLASLSKRGESTRTKNTVPAQLENKKSISTASSDSVQYIDTRGRAMRSKNYGRYHEPAAKSNGESPSKDLMSSVQTAYAEANANRSSLDPMAVTGELTPQDIAQASSNIDDELLELGVKPHEQPIFPTDSEQSSMEQQGILSEQSKSLFFRVKFYLISYQKRVK